MNTKLKTRVIEVPPLYLLKKDAMKYVGMERTTFNKATKEAGLTIYARGPKKIWYKVNELNKMLESYRIK